MDESLPTIIFSYKTHFDYVRSRKQPNGLVHMEQASFSFFEISVPTRRY